MKKDRNSFFSEYGFNSMNPNMGAGVNPNMMVPNQGVAANNSFYAGPMPPNSNLNPNMYTDIDSRISKLERQINRLETRVSRLEGNQTAPSTETDYNYANNMYMV